MKRTLPVGILLFLSLSSPVSSIEAQESTKEPSPQAYHDDHDHRILAAVHLKLIEKDGEAHVQMLISAVGPQVAPMHGWQGIRGSNLVTARQFEKILAGRFPVVVATRFTGQAEPVYGKIRAGKFGSVPIRCLGEDGRIDFLSLTKHSYPLELVVDAGPVPSGLHFTDIYLNHANRLQVGYLVAGPEVKVIDFRSLGDPRHPPAGGAQKPPAPLPPVVLVKAPLAVAQPEEKTRPLPPPVTNAEWDKRDLEGKWVYYQKSVEQDSETYAAWLQYLDKRNDFAFLERLALYEGNMNALKILSRQKAPQWMRVAVWLRQAYPSQHEPNDTHWMITGSDPAFAYSYLKKYKEVVQKGPLEFSYLALEKANLPLVDVSKALPPFDLKEVFRYLDAPGDISDFGDRERAEAGKVYLHQVLRTIDAFTLSNRYQQPWLGKLTQLTRHPNEKIRQAGYLAFTHFRYSNVNPGDIPYREFTNAANSINEPPAIREAALMAYSYYDHPEVYLKLLRVARETDHPGWNAAVSRLFDLGNDFTLKYLQQIPEQDLTPKKKQLLRSMFDRFDQWQRTREPESWVYFLPIWLEYAAWAEHVNDPLRKQLTPWTKEILANNGGAQLEEKLEKIAMSYAPRFRVENDQALFVQRVRQLAGAILAERKK
jgi:hypothetical protein